MACELFTTPPTSMGYGNDEAFYPPKDVRAINLSLVSFVEFRESGVRLHIGHAWFEYAWGKAADAVNVALLDLEEFPASGGEQT